VELKTVWAIIPAYNAESTIGEVIERTKKYIPRVIVVNDGSTDRTEDVAHKRATEVLSLPSNRGKGFALRQGFGLALSNGCRAILTLDADGQHDPVDIPNFLTAHERDTQAILIGSRMAQADHFPTQRYYSNRTAAFFISKALGQSLEDTQCGFRLYPAEILRSIPLTTSHFQTETEVLLRAVQRGIRLNSVPVKNIYHLNGNAPRSNFRPVIDTFYICMVVLQSYLKLLN
jgi:glycosyltransferase involved in cell wall biosynthesis